MEEGTAAERQDKNANPEMIGNFLFESGSCIEDCCAEGGEFQQSYFNDVSRQKCFLHSASHALNSAGMLCLCFRNIFYFFPAASLAVLRFLFVVPSEL